MSEPVSPTNGVRPVSISYNTHPYAQMSVRLSTGLPRACSGLMYPTVPRIIPWLVSPIIIVGACVIPFNKPGVTSSSPGAPA